MEVKVKDYKDLLKVNDAYLVNSDHSGYHAALRRAEYFNLKEEKITELESKIEEFDLKINNIDEKLQLILEFLQDKK